MLLDEGLVIAERDVRAGPSARAKNDSSNAQERRPRESRTCGASRVNRGDRTPVELFVQGIRAWEPGIRGLLAVEP